MRPSQLLAAVVAVSSLSAAWPDVFDSGNAVAHVNNMLQARQENQESESSESAQPSNTREPTRTSAQEEEPTNTESPDEEEETDKPTPTEEESGSGKPSETGKTSGTGKPSQTKKPDEDDKKTTGKPKPTSFDARLPAGGISMITPAPMAGPQFYKIGEWVTLAWNYTSLKATPSAVDVLASCQANQATYTLAVNQTIEPTNQVILWDTKSYMEKAQKEGKTPLLTEKYTLIVYDSESSISAAPQAGYLGTSNLFTFGMYEPQPYVKWKDFKCANCNPNAGLSAFDSLTLRAIMITCGTTFGSLLYFAYSFGVL